MFILDLDRRPKPPNMGAQPIYRYTPASIDAPAASRIFYNGFMEIVEPTEPVSSLAQLVQPS